MQAPLSPSPLYAGERVGVRGLLEDQMPQKRDHSERLLGFARQMRKEPTDAEKRMWRLLRDRQLGQFKFRRQYPVSGYIIDFFCARCRLGVELDGGQHNDEP